MCFYGVLFSPFVSVVDVGTSVESLMCFQGVSFAVHVHPARALTEQKEFSASPLYVDSGAFSALGSGLRPQF